MEYYPVEMVHATSGMGSVAGDSQLMRPVGGGNVAGLNAADLDENDMLSKELRKIGLSPLS